MRSKRALLILEAIIVYMTVMNIVSHQLSPQQYAVAEGAPLLTSGDLISFTGEQNAGDSEGHIFSDTAGAVVGFWAALDLSTLSRIHISFHVDCPAEYAGKVLFTDLYDFESGYDNSEQEYALTLQEGANDVSVSLEPGVSAPQKAQFRIFTVDTADYSVRDVRVEREERLRKTTGGMWAAASIAVLCFAVTLLSGEKKAEAEK